MSKTADLDDLTDILTRLDEQADNAAWTVKNYSEPQAERVLDEALNRLSARWRGDMVEATARKLWLRGEVLRRLPKIGSA